jgi:thiamine biosynthesis lipoprotein
MGKEYTIGLSKPYDFNGYIGIIKDKDKVISCSSPQNQYVNIDGNIYHHLINPFNGYPSNKYDSIFVFNQNALEGDAYSTALFNMGFDKAVNFAKINNLDILMYSKDKILFQTEGVKLYE